MEYYVMPQVDKSASTYSPPVQYVPALPARPELNKYGVSSDILTSCDWSAVIHRPAEDSEPEDLPSTVDMDAIKEPATPLPPPLTPAPPPVSEEDSDSEEETSNSDSDSSSDSNSESQGSGSGSVSSDSSGDSSAKKNNSSTSSRTPSPQTTFSIRETNFEQGGLKLKISATKPKIAVKVRSSSSSSDPYDSSSSEEDVRNGVAGRRRDGGRSRVTKESSAAAAALRRKPGRRRQVMRTRGRLMGRQQASRRSPRTLLKPKEGCNESSSTSSSSSSSEDEEDEDDEEEERDGDEMAELATQLGSSEHSIPISEHLQVINEEDLAAILPDVGGGSLDGFEGGGTSTTATTGGGPSGSSSGGGAGSSSGATSQQQPPPPPADSLSSSSSDAELLPEEVVSEAISRIQVDPESVGGGQQQRAPPSPRPSNHHTHQHHVGRCYSSNLLEDFVEKTEMLSRGGGGGEPSGTGADMGRKKRGRPPKSSRLAPAPAVPDLESYPCQSNVSPDSGIQSVAGSPAPHQSSPVSSPPPPAVSQAPSQGAQPHLRRRPPPLAINDAITKMQSKQGELKLENGGKRGPGRPKGSIKLRKSRGRSAGSTKKEVVKKKPPPVVLPAADAELKVPPYIAGSVQATQIPSLPGTSKRGRGRPRKEGGPPPLLAPPPPPSSSRSASCPRLLRIKQHKHRRRRLRLDPLLAAQVDDLAQELQRVVIGSGRAHRPLEGGIPPVFRVKRVVKKRKEKEERRKEKEDKEERRKEKEEKEERRKEKEDKEERRKEKEDKEERRKEIGEGGGKEVAGGSPPRAASPPSPAPATPSASSTAKRRLKKSTAVELPKNREKLEANNEQRLPLKKRHYHMSSATSTNQTSVDSTDKSDSSVDSTQSKPAVRSPAPVCDKSVEKHHHHSGKHHVSGKGGPVQAVSSSKAAVSEKGATQVGVAPQGASAPSTNSKSHHISAKAEVKKSEAKDDVESRMTRSSDQHETVIVTPKKRHCLEADKKTPTIRHALREKEPSPAGKRTPRPKDQSPSTKRSVTARTVVKVDEANPSSPVTSPTPKRSQRIMESQAAQEAQKKSAAANKTEETDEKKENKKAESKVGTIKPEDTPVEKGATPAAVATRSSSKTTAAPPVSSTAEATPSEEKLRKITMENKIKSEKRIEDSKLRPDKREESKSKLEKRPEEPKLMPEKEHEENKLEKKVEEQGKTRSERRVEEIKSRSEKKVKESKVKKEKKVEEGRKRSERKAEEARRRNEKKPPQGVFEPSEKVGGPEALEKIIGSTEASAKCVEEVISKIKERLKPLQELENVCVESESIRVRRANEDEEATAKKRKLICDVRVHVTKLTPADFILQNVIAPTCGTPTTNKVKVKRKRKPINRTGFPVIKRKKKKKIIDPILLSEATILSDTTEEVIAPSVSVVEMEKVIEAHASPPILEDQTKLSVITTLEQATPALSPLTEVEEIVKVKDEEKSGLNALDSEPAQQQPATSDIDLKEEVKSVEPCPPPEEKEMVPEVETMDKEAEEETGGLSTVEVRPPSKRIMELRSARAVASERRKRKSVVEEGDGDLTDSSANGTESRLSIAKRLRRIRDELEDSDADSMKLRRKHPQKSKKKYLPAGLFSDYFKEDEGRKQLTSNEVAKLRNNYVRPEHPYGLMPPPAYYSRWVRQRRRHFQLPHDLWWLHVHNKLPGREAVPSWNYKKIRTNVYFDVKPTLSYEAQACNCDASSGCDEECINRMVLAECSPQLCPCRESCTNQRIQKHDWAPGIAKFMTKDKGWGVKTKNSIKKDDFILEYVGEVVSEKEFKNRMASRYQNDTHHYCLNLDSGLVIDGHRMGGDGRFVNHSCEPNCGMQKWCVNGLFRMALFALRDIASNEELTYDYNFSLFNPSEGQPCKCGSSKCRGVIGGKWQRMVLSGPGAGAVVTTTAGAGGGGQPGAGGGNGGIGLGAPEGEVKPPGQVGRPRKNNNNNHTGDTSNNNGRRKATLVTHTLKKHTGAIKNGSGKDGTTFNGSGSSSSALATVAARLNNLTPVRPLTHLQKTFVLANRCFLVRNLEKVRKCRERLKQVMRGGGGTTVAGGGGGSAPPTQHAFMTQMTALSVSRSVRTRRLALAQGDEELTKTAKLACIFKELYKAVLSAKDERGELLSTPFMTLPSKKKCPEYYTRITAPVDLTMVGANISSGVYRSVELFDTDMTAVFKNAVRWYGRTTELGIAATRLRRAYSLAKVEAVPGLEEALGAPPPAQFLPPKQDPGGEEEDVIRCLCGLYRDEGLMIQCERCLVWQHAWCVARGAEPTTSPDEVPYLCERCSPREVDLEVPVQPGGPPPSPGQLNFITLLRGNIQLRQGDTVYVLRDIVNEESTTIPKEKHTYRTIKDWKYSDCDIFRIERLWKDDEGKRFAFGHHYLRPHETFHEPTRRFFENEVMRVPLYEVVPIELIMGHCTVLDLNTFCKGRPLGSSPEHTYICEYRVDKYARMFAKIPKPKSSSVCTKSYAFEMYDVRLKPQRTYAPHGITETVNINRGRGGKSVHDQSEKNGGVTTQQQQTTNGAGKQQTLNGNHKQHTSNGNQKHQRQSHNNKQQSKQASQEIQVDQISPEETMAINRERKKTRLNGYLLKLLSKLPSKQPLDLSFLLEPGRRQRKKPPLLSS